MFGLDEGEEIGIIVENLEIYPKLELQYRVLVGSGPR